ncbi:hypothetical protein [Roseibium sp. Sym1]|uniref:hypothetical protein n=1 Tax=Roseibium sp. Sym1 TaxID=3016006 RepID=UPI0022B4821F|nr:hypothetical protein [Roseibium sp. Sym1]
MSRADNTKPRKPSSHKTDLHEARPLLQAIFLGIVLASALVAAAAMATPRDMGGTSPQSPAVQSSLPTSRGG